MMINELGLETVAWLVEKGRVWKDRAYISERGASESVAERNDGSCASPLCRIADAEAIIAQQEARIAELEQQRGGVVPVGYAVVPVEPTPAMLSAAMKTAAAMSQADPDDIERAIWHNMVAVARLNQPGECVTVLRELLARMADMLDDCRGELYRHGVSPSCLVDPTLNSPSLSRLDVIREQSRAIIAQQGKESK